jgi:hypothetical protein
MPQLSMSQPSMSQHFTSPCFSVSFQQAPLVPVAHASDPELSTVVLAEAMEVFHAVLKFSQAGRTPHADSQDSTLIGLQPMGGADATRALAVPMITLNVICEIRECGDPNA